MRSSDEKKFDKTKQKSTITTNEAVLAYIAVSGITQWHSGTPTSKFQQQHATLGILLATLHNNMVPQDKTLCL